MMGSRLVPRLLPGTDVAPSETLTIPTYMMVFISIVIPVIVVVIAMVVWLRFGQSAQYDDLYVQARNWRSVAASSADPVSQRNAWQSVLTTLDKADAYRQTPESDVLRQEAQANYDQIMGIIRLEFIPAFANGVSGVEQFSRLADSESDLYMLDAGRAATCMLHSPGGL